MARRATQRAPGQRPGRSEKKKKTQDSRLFNYMCLYKKNIRLSAQRIQLISETLGLDETQVATWLNSRRERNLMRKSKLKK